MNNALKIWLAISVIALMLDGCKKNNKVANPTAVQVYKVSITQFPESPLGGGTWDTEIAFTDPWGRPDLKVTMTTDSGQYVGAPYGYIRFNADHGNLPLNFDIDTLSLVPLDRRININLVDNDDFDPDDYIGDMQSDILSSYKTDQPDYISVSSGSIAARLYLHWQ
ncbi:MAG: hypothetical protein JWO06_3758 [Bacteroidota bacterium]|nr:hypothetical protein [Bacteroidota bacterium]